MAEQTDTVEMTTWTEGARRHVRKQEEALERCQAEIAHYASIVEEHEYDWEQQELSLGQVEALGVENYKLKAECKALRARLALTRSPVGTSGGERIVFPLSPSR